MRTFVHSIFTLSVLSLLADQSYGGGKRAPTKKQAASVEKGFEWLKKNQNKDGSWGCEENQPESVALTSMAILAFMADGHTYSRGKYSGNVKKGFKWLVNNQNKDVIAAYDASGMGETFEHAAGVMAITFLYSHVDKDSEEKVKEKLKRSVSVLDALIQPSNTKFTGNVKGGYGLLAVALLALKSAYYGGVTSRIQLEEVKKFFQKSNPVVGDFYSFGAQLRILHSLGILTKSKRNKLIDSLKSVRLVSTQGGLSEYEYLGIFYAVPIFLQTGKKDNLKWVEEMKDLIVSLQRTDGSWIVERCLNCKTFATSLAIITLLSHSEILPLSEY